MISPRVSVLVSMQAARGAAARALHSWTANQSCDPTAFEVIVLVGPGQGTAPIRAVLRPNDRVIEHDSPLETIQLQHGAQCARGDILFFTEGHCIAQPDTIAATLEAFADPDVDGILGRSFSVDRRTVSRMETRAFEESFPDRIKPDAWRKVAMRCFAIRKSVYAGAGGLQGQLSLFAEYLLAATLHRQGARLVYAPRVLVEHVNVRSFRELRESIRDCVEPECEFRSTTTELDVWTPYIGTPQEWIEACERAVSRRGAIQFILAACRSLPPNSGQTRVAWMARAKALQLVPTAALGRTALRLRYRLRRVARRMEFHAAVGNADRRLELFKRYWDAIAQDCRVRCGLRAARAARGSLPTYGRSNLANTFGFYVRESYHGLPFRWSGEFAGIWIPALDGARQIVLQTAQVRPLRPSELIASMNRRIVDVQQDDEHGGICIDVGPRHFSHRAGEWLLLSTRPWQRSLDLGQDPRKLGVDLAAIRVVGEDRDLHIAM